MIEIKLLLIAENFVLRNRILQVLKPYKEILLLNAPLKKDLNIKFMSINPQVIIMDLGIMGLKSVEPIHIVRIEFPSAKIVLMDIAPIQLDILSLIKAGVKGFILKEASIDDFLITIHSVALGIDVLPALLVDSLFSQIARLSVKDDNYKRKDIGLLTKRETEVISVLLNGMTNKDISKMFQISTYTVKSHIRNIMEKLDVHTRLEIVNHFRKVET